jgi:hypothetical protein
MLKKTALCIAVALCVVSTLASQTSPTAPGSQLSGTVTLGFGDLNVLGSPYYADIPGISSSYATSLLSIAFSDGFALSYLDLSQYQQEFRAEDRIGYEFGITVDTANMLAWTAPVSKWSDNSDYSWYSYLQPMIDWWENNERRFGLSEDPYGGAGWPTTSYGMSAGRYQFIYGSTVEPIQWVAWDDTKWGDARALFTDIKAKILAQIELISSDVTSSAGISQYDFENLTPAQQELVRAELRAYYEFNTVCGGYETKAALSTPGIKSAYLAFTNLFGFMNARVEFLGAKLATGSYLVTPRASAPASGPALTFSLAPGVFTGFDASIAAGLTGGLPAIVENYETRILEAWPGEASWFGLKAKAGYEVDDVLDVDLTIYWPDMIVRPLTLGANLQARWTLDGELSAEVFGEASFLTWQDRYVPSTPIEIGYAGALDASVSYFGATFHALALYKNAGFYGAGGSETSDRFSGVDLLSDFGSSKLVDSLAADAGFSYDFWLLTGMRLATIDAGYRLFLYGLTDPIAQGWYANATITFEDLLNIPVWLSIGATNYKNWSQYDEEFADFNVGPTAGLLTGLTWNLALVVAPTDKIELSLNASGKDSGWRMDTSQVISVGFNAVVSF